MDREPAGLYSPWGHKQSDTAQHSITYDSGFFIFISKYYSTYYFTALEHFTDPRHLGSLQFEAMTDKAAVNILVHTSVCIYVWVFPQLWFSNLIVYENSQGPFKIQIPGPSL